MSKRFICPPAVAAAARKLARDQSVQPGNIVEWRLKHEIETEVDILGEPHVGQMTLNETFAFEVLPDGGLAFRGKMAVIEDDQLHRGTRKGGKPCGHPDGCGEPCQWCELKTAAGAVLVAARGCDVSATLAAMGYLARVCGVQWDKPSDS